MWVRQALGSWQGLGLAGQTLVVWRVVVSGGIKRAIRARGADAYLARWPTGPIELTRWPTGSIQAATQHAQRSYWEACSVNSSAYWPPRAISEACVPDSMTEP